MHRPACGSCHVCTTHVSGRPARRADNRTSVIGSSVSKLNCAHSTTQPRNTPPNSRAYLRHAVVAGQVPSLLQWCLELAQVPELEGAICTGWIACTAGLEIPLRSLHCPRCKATFATPMAEYKISFAARMAGKDANHSMPARPVPGCRFQAPVPHSQSCKMKTHSGLNSAGPHLHCERASFAH